MHSRRDHDPSEADTLAGSHTSEDLYGPVLGVGAAVGPYVVEDICTRGGFAVVYRAREPATGRVAALKVLHEHLSTSTQIVRRFYQEAETIRSLHHPGIVDFLDAGQLVDGRPFLVLEWVEGATLADTLEGQGRLDLEEATRIAGVLAEALATAHAAGVVHRDLKSSNVMLSRDVPPAVKLLDFGIAKMLDAGQGLTTTGVLIGTPSYMAPEQILGNPITPATDIYALGILLFQMLTGVLPFRADTVVEVQGMHLSLPPPRASDLVAVPAGVEDVILRCLEKEPDRRFASAADFSAALAAAVRAPARESHRLAARTVPALGLHVGAKPAPGAAAALAAARRACEEARLGVTLDLDTAFLAVRLPSGAAPAARPVLELAVSLARGAAGMPLQVTVHAAHVTVLEVEGAQQIVAGELLAVGAWTGGHPGAGVVLTDAARGLLDAGAGLELTPAPGRGDAWWLR